MSVSVDYDDDSNIDVIYSVWGSEAWLEDVHGAVDDRGEDIYDYLKALDDAATYAAEYALASVEKLKNFQADVTQVTFTAPDAPSLSSESFSAGAIDTDVEPISAGLAGSVGMPNFATILQSSVKAPAAVRPPDIPDAPALSSGVELPPAPAVYEFPNVEAPEFVLAPFVATAIDAPALANVRFSVPAPIEFDALSLSTNTSALDEAISRLENMPIEMVVIPEYDDILPEIFTVTGSLLNGIPNFDSDTTERALADLRDLRQSVTEVFSRRGIDVANVATDWVDQAASARIARMDAAGDIELAEQCIIDGYKVATAAVMMQNDFELKLYDLAFAAARARALVFLELAKSVAAIYDARLVELQTVAANYNAQAAQLSALASAFTASAKATQYTGELNKQIASLFSATEQVKGIDADLFKARVKAEASKLEAYRATIEGYAASLAEAEAGMATYSATSQSYAASVERLSANYDLAATKARAVAYENRALATSVKASATQLKSIASKAQVAASQAASQAVRLNASAAQREIPHDLATVQNSSAGVQSAAAALGYAKRVANYVADLRGKSVSLGAQADYGQLLARYFERASNSAERAATVMARANEELARAYARVYDAAGRAGAAVESGKLSGFRASATLSAGDSLTASENRSVNYGSSGAKGYSESYNRSLNLSA